MYQVGVRPSYATGFDQWPGMSEYPQLWEGLVAAYAPFLGMTGKKLLDLSGNGKDGTFSGSPVWSSGEFGHAIEFTGGDRIDSSENSNLSGSFTFLAGAKAADWNADGELAIVVVSEVASYSNYWAQLGGGGASTATQFALYDGSNNPKAIYTSTPTNEWIQMVGVRDVNKDTLKYYLNGLLRTSAEDTTTSIPAYDALNFGQQEELTDRDLHGLIDHVIIWNRALSSSEIALLYHLMRRLA